MSWLNHKPVEWGLVLVAAGIGTVSAWRGIRMHGNRALAVVLVAAAAGLVILTATHSGHDHAHAHGHDHGVAWLSAIFGVALGGALLVNQRLCKNCEGCASHGPVET